MSPSFATRSETQSRAIAHRDAKVTIEQAGKTTSTPILLFYETHCRLVVNFERLARDRMIAPADS